MLILALALLFTACGDKKEAAKKPEVTKNSTDQKPKIAAKNTDFNFGKVKEGEVVEHVFKIQNKGGAELKIEKATGS